MNNNEILCPICLDAIDYNTKINGKYPYTLPECNDTFHAECIVHWFRSGRPDCPCCREKGKGVNSPLALSDWKVVSNYSRRKDAPVEMKQYMKKYKTQKNRIDELTAEIAHTKNQTGIYKELNGKVRELSRKRWYSRRKMFIIKKQICNLYPITNLIIVTREKI